MTLIKNVWSDLLEKRLWPLALLLVVALIAVPVVLGRSSSGSGATEQAVVPAPVPGADGEAAPAPQVALDNALTQGRVDRKGAVRDPFTQLHTPKVVTSTAGGAAAKVQSVTGGASSGDTTISGGSGSKGSGSTGSGTGSTGGATVPPKTTTPPAKPDIRDLYRATLRFGLPGQRRVHRDIKRLTPLPSSEFPFFVYLGVLNDAKTGVDPRSAVFLIASDVTATGDGTCRPSKTTCQTIELKPGETEYFDYSPTGEEADIQQFQLDMLSVRRVTAKTEAFAAKAKAAVHRTGRMALKAARTAGLVPQLHRYSYSARDGLLHRTHSHKARISSHRPVPRTAFKRTHWGLIQKVSGAVIFAVKIHRKAAHTRAAG